VASLRLFLAAAKRVDFSLSWKEFRFCVMVNCIKVYLVPLVAIKVSWNVR